MLRHLLQDPESRGRVRVPRAQRGLQPALFARPVDQCASEVHGGARCAHDAASCGTTLCNVITLRYYPVQGCITCDRMQIPLLLCHRLSGPNHSGIVLVDSYANLLGGLSPAALPWIWLSGYALSCLSCGAELQQDSRGVGQFCGLIAVALPHDSCCVVTRFLALWLSTYQLSWPSSGGYEVRLEAQSRLRNLWRVARSQRAGWARLRRAPSFVAIRDQIHQL